MNPRLDSGCAALGPWSNSSDTVRWLNSSHTLSSTYLSSVLVPRGSLCGQSRDSCVHNSPLGLWGLVLLASAQSLLQTETTRSNFSETQDAHLHTYPIHVQAWEVSWRRGWGGFSSSVYNSPGVLDTTGLAEPLWVYRHLNNVMDEMLLVVVSKSLVWLLLICLLKTSVWKFGGRGKLFAGEA